MATPKQLIDQAGRHAVYLEGHKTHAANELSSLLKKMETAALSGLANENITEWGRDRLETQLMATRRAMAEAAAGVTDKVKRQILDLAEYEAGFEARSLNQAVVRDYNIPSNTQLNSAVMSTPLQATGPYQGQLLESFIDGWSTRSIEKLEGAIKLGFARGETTAKLVSDLRGMGGVFDMERRDLTAIVRTGMNHAATTAREMTWKANADIIKGVRIVATLDSRTSALCASLDGQVYPLDKGPRPPFHINCRTTTAASLDDRFSMLNEGGTRTARGKDGKVMHVPANQTYYDWLKKQPKGFQDSVIGPTRGKLLRDGGMSSERFAELQLGKRFEPLTIQKMRELEPFAFEKAGLGDVSENIFVRTDPKNWKTNLTNAFVDTKGNVQAQNLVPQYFKDAKPAASFNTAAEQAAADAAMKARIDDIISDPKFTKADAVKQRLDIADLTTIQGSVDKITVEKIATVFDQKKFRAPGIPTVYKMPDGKHVLMDGNARVSGAIMAGIDKLVFNVVDISVKGSTGAIKAAKTATKRATKRTITPATKTSIQTALSPTVKVATKAAQKSAYNPPPVPLTVFNSGGYSANEFKIELGKLPRAIQRMISTIPVRSVDRLSDNIAGVMNHSDSRRIAGQMSVSRRAKLVNRIDVAENIVSGERRFLTRDKIGTLYHEVGHAIDLKLGWISTRMYTTFLKEYNKLSANGKAFSEYYNSNTREMFAEMFRLTFSSSSDGYAKAFAMPLDRARSKFKESIAYMKEQLAIEIKKQYGDVL